jgi:hypothetical protein
MKLVNKHSQTNNIPAILFNRISSSTSPSVGQCNSVLIQHRFVIKNLQMSRNNVAIGEQKEKEAKANLIPKVTVNTDYKYFTNLPYQLMPLSTFNPTAPEGTV